MVELLNWIKYLVIVTSTCLHALNIKCSVFQLIIIISLPVIVVADLGLPGRLVGQALVIMGEIRGLVIRGVFNSYNNLCSLELCLIVAFAQSSFYSSSANLAVLAHSLLTSCLHSNAKLLSCTAPHS